MDIVKGFIRGFVLPLKGGSMVFSTPGARRWAFFPLAVNFILYILLIFVAFWLIDVMKIPEVTWTFWGGIGVYFSDAVNYLAPALKWLVLVPLMVTVCYFSFTFIGMLVATPFNDILSEKIEMAITCGDIEGSIPLKMTLNAFIISLYSTTRFFAKQMFYSIVCLPLLLIPGVGAVLLFLVSSHYAGIGFLDIGMARNYLGYRHKMAAVRHRRWEVLGLGAAMELMFLVPVAGLFLLPLGVAGGTLLYCDIDWRLLLDKEMLDFPFGFSPPEKKIFSATQDKE